MTSQVPLKVSIFVWRLLRDRLPTKANLWLFEASTYCSSFVCFWLWWGGVGSSPISLMWYFWSSLGISVFVDCHPGGGVHFSTWSSCSVYFFHRWFSGTSLIYAAHLGCLRLGGVDGEESQVVLRLNKHSSSIVGQDQTFFISVVEGDECYFSI
jgi:hypothetical protein